VDRLQKAIDQKGSKVKAKAEVVKQVEELKRQLPEATQSVDQVVLEELEGQQALLKNIEEQISARGRRRRTIEGLIESYAAIKKSTAREIDSIKRQLLDAGVADGTAQKWPPAWAPDVDELLRNEVEKLDDEIASLTGSESAPKDPASVIGVRACIAELKERVAKDEVSRKRLLDLQRQIAERTSTAERLAKEILNLDEKVTNTLEKQMSKQVDLYLDVFKALSTDEAGLKELYSPMQDAIDELGDEMQFSVSVGYQIDSKSWLDRSSRFYDGRRVGAEAKRNEIERIVDTKLVPAWKSGDSGKIKDAVEEVLAAVDARTFPEKFGTSKLSRVELFDWMFSVEHIELSYKIHYSGTELEYLSPGTRGIALLVLYLLMDEDDTRPLLIDQPEGNLDNSSVYKQLVPYIRKAKKRRQIILITHNPNLVVATDAEQIIIATADRPTNQPYPCLRYDSGGLEHSVAGSDLGVREAVCLLLEGGEDAFRARENRYSLMQL
jgi:DNA repair exonuclease SbcCD ATPase subunit